MEPDVMVFSSKRTNSVSFNMTVLAARLQFKSKILLQTSRTTDDVQMIKGFILNPSYPSLQVVVAVAPPPPLLPSLLLGVSERAQQHWGHLTLCSRFQEESFSCCFCPGGVWTGRQRMGRSGLCEI